MLIDCLRELGQRIHGSRSQLRMRMTRPQNVLLTRQDDTSVSLNSNDVLMLHGRLKMIQEHTTEANKGHAGGREDKGRVSEQNSADRTVDVSEERTHS